MDQFSSVAKSCPNLCDPKNHSTPVLPVHHQLPESTETHVHRVGDTISHSVLCRPLLLLILIPPSIRVFSNESTLLMRWPKYWSFSFSIIPSKEYPGHKKRFQIWPSQEKINEIYSSYIHSCLPYRHQHGGKLIQSCPTLCDPMYHSLSDSSVHGILEARILDWVFMLFSRGGDPNPGIEPVSLMSPALAGGFFPISATSQASAWLSN